MNYSIFKEKRISQLGFGAMRLPTVSINGNAVIDEEQTEAMVRYAYEHGVNYFDTAYPYHEGESERVIGRLLKQYPRESYFLATKYPGHQILQSYEPSDIFEEQLQKCGVDYFDFFLLHNVFEGSLRTYTDARWGILEYFVEQKRKGRIRHLGFSTHGDLPIIRAFLDTYGDSMEFCQIQLNYLDWTFQHASEKYALLRERGIPIIVMEPVRGGKLASLSEENEAKLRALRPDESIAAWAFRWLQTLPDIMTVLSGMSSMEQLKDNVKTYTTGAPLDERESDLLLEIAEGLKNSLPCTACRYCCPACPKQLDIPWLISIYNQMRFAPSINNGMRVESLPIEKRPSACINCGACVPMCPQSIDIPAAMRDFADAFSKLPSWAEISRQRDEAARRLRENVK